VFKSRISFSAGKRANLIDWQPGQGIVLWPIWDKMVKWCPIFLNSSVVAFKVVTTPLTGDSHASVTIAIFNLGRLKLKDIF
jgi:hypothetical protein